MHETRLPDETREKRACGGESMEWQRSVPLVPPTGSPRFHIELTPDFGSNRGGVGVPLKVTPSLLVNSLLAN